MNQNMYADIAGDIYTFSTYSLPSKQSLLMFCFQTLLDCSVTSDDSTLLPFSLLIYWLRQIFFGDITSFTMYMTDYTIQYGYGLIYTLLPIPTDIYKLCLFCNVTLKLLSSFIILLFVFFVLTKLYLPIMCVRTTISMSSWDELPGH